MTETSLNLGGDLGAMAGGIGQVATALSEMGADELAESTTAFAQSLQLFAGLSTIASSVTSLMAVRNTASKAQLLTTTAAMSANPIAWPQLALGLAVGGVATTVVYSFLHDYTIRSDLSTDSGLLGSVSTVGALL